MGSWAFGVDIVPLARAGELVRRMPESAVREILSLEGQKAAGPRAVALARALCVRESVVKASGGKRWAFRWSDLLVTEVDRDAVPEPLLGCAEPFLEACGAREPRFIRCVAVGGETLHAPLGLAWAATGCTHEHALGVATARQ